MPDDPDNFSAGHSLRDPPAEDEIELSLFGPGYGEGLAVHLGAGEWMLVDSCIGSAGGPATIQYLETIGVDPALAVKLVVATHWHDDHVGALATLVERCHAASVACSVALLKEEFLTLTEMYNERTKMFSTGVEEFRKILETLKVRTARGRPTTIVNAIADRRLWQRVPSDGPVGDVYALSPSDYETVLAQTSIAELMRVEDRQKNRVPVRKPNHVAVALWVRVGAATVLLGSDLETSPDERLGWLAIIGSSNRPAGAASAFKIAHHGAVSSHEPRVWTEMLSVNPPSVLTPFWNAGVRLPTSADVRRIKTSTTMAYVTAIPTARRRRRERTVQKTIEESVRSIREVYTSTGHIRMRARVSGLTEWRVEMFNGAVAV